jgi:hypothetical protein
MVLSVQLLVICICSILAEPVKKLKIYINLKWVTKNKLAADLTQTRLLIEADFKRKMF